MPRIYKVRDDVRQNEMNKQRELLLQKEILKGKKELAADRMDIRTCKGKEITSKLSVAASVLNANISTSTPLHNILCKSYSYFLTMARRCLIATKTPGILQIICTSSLNVNTLFYAESACYFFRQSLSRVALFSFGKFFDSSRPRWND